MLASNPASMVNQNPTDLGIPNRFNLSPSRFSVGASGSVRYCRLGDQHNFRVKSAGLTPADHFRSTQLTDIIRPAQLVRLVPCVDGSGLARIFFTFAALVGAAMCSAC